MRFPLLVPGRFYRRDNRFRATVLVEGEERWAHVPNSGRLTELFVPGQPLWLAPAEADHRKTAFDLKLVAYAGVLVSVDARLPNPLLAEALAGGLLPDFPYPEVAREVILGDSRLDFHLSGPDGVCWLETKSVTLVEEGIARFPDAPTGRGRRHLLELEQACRAGQRAAVVFVIQRPDARAFRPHESADPAFAETLRRVAAAGVEVRALTCHVSLEEIAIAREIPVLLEP
jgi:sugar fermentation stimulation protein A